jgi:hypothetical protein
MKKYLQLEGLVYKLVPYRNTPFRQGKSHTSWDELTCRFDVRYCPAVGAGEIQNGKTSITM